MKTQTIAQKIILGSSSIYRKELLQRLQIPFQTVSPEINEMPLDNESPEETAARLAEAKAREVARIFPQALIIGSDQVAVLEDTRLGKPLNHGNATEQLRLMRGKAVSYTHLTLPTNREV